MSTTDGPSADRSATGDGAATTDGGTTATKPGGGTATKTGGVGAPDGRTAAPRWAPWRAAHRRRLDPEDRRRVMEAVALRTEDGWASRFTIMMALSIVVAVMGLSADSAAVVIGAMLLAPLMTPVLGVAAALAMGLTRRLLRSAGIVVAATVGAIAFAGLLALLIPGDDLSDEVLARTSPDLRDLLVAFAAGGAGAYATVRRDVSSALPGVAVAVALVPPLATVGITIVAGRGDLAGGAMLLYLANLTAIILTSAIVFVLTGFVPPRRLAQKGWHVLGGGAFAMMSTVAVAIPIGVASYNAALAGETRTELLAAAESWLQGTGDRVDEVRVDDDTVFVEITGPNQPADTDTFLRAVQQIMGSDTQVRISWTQTQDASNTGDAAATATVAQDDGTVREHFLELVDEWFTSGSEGAYEVTDLTIDREGISLAITSAAPPPPALDLSELVTAELGVDVPIAVEWIGRTSVDELPDPDATGADGTAGAGDTDPDPDTTDDGTGTDTTNSGSTPIFEVETELRTAARRWAAERPEVGVVSVRYDGVTVSIDLIGSEAPGIAELEEVIGTVTPDAELAVWFTERQRLTVTPDPAQPTDTAPPPTTAPAGTGSTPTTAGG